MGGAAEDVPAIVAAGVTGDVRAVVVRLGARADGTAASGARVGVLQRHRSVQLNVDAQGVAEAGGEDVDLLQLGDVVATGEELQEVVRVLRDRADTLKLNELPKRVAARRRPKASGEEVRETLPGWNALIALKTKVPSLGVAIHVEGR
jgi:hypothetical protein